MASKARKRLVKEIIRRLRSPGKRGIGKRGGTGSPVNYSGPRPPMSDAARWRRSRQALETRRSKRLQDIGWMAAPNKFRTGRDRYIDGAGRALRKRLEKYKGR